jgi:hypothetical protein
MKTNENDCPNGQLLCLFGNPLMCGCGPILTEETAVEAPEVEAPADEPSPEAE